MRFRKSIKIAPGLKINLSKSGISTTVGGKGLSANIGSRGAYLNTGIPGTGVSARHKLPGSSGNGAARGKPFEADATEEAFVPANPAFMRGFGILLFVIAALSLLVSLAIGIPGLILAGICIFFGICLCQKPKKNKNPGDRPGT
jgi:hypothetical protein